MPSVYVRRAGLERKSALDDTVQLAKFGIVAVLFSSPLLVGREAMAAQDPPTNPM